MQNNPPSNGNSADPHQEPSGNDAQKSANIPIPFNEGFGNPPEPEYREYTTQKFPSRANTIPPTYRPPAQQQSAPGASIPPNAGNVPPAYWPPAQQQLNSGVFAPPNASNVPPAYWSPAQQQPNSGVFAPPPTNLPGNSYPPYNVPPYGAPAALPPQMQTPPSRKEPVRKRTLFVTLASVLLAVIVILAIIFAFVPRLSQPSPVSKVNPTATVCSGTSASCSGSTPSPQTGQPTAAFHSSACAIPLGKGIVEGQQARCGYVTVPENRSVNNGRMVTLPIIIFKSTLRTSTEPDPNPVLRLEGGPGGSSLDGWAKYFTADNYNTFVFQHDLIMFDQRGTGHSTPSLKCPEITALQYQESTTNQQYEDAARACHTRLAAQGIDLSAYNSLENAADVRDIIHALGYKQMTIYGVSYGTRLALTVMRLYPSVVHAAILDSVYPPNHNRNDLTSDAQRVFSVLFQGCAKDPNCNSKYPQLQNVFYKLVDSLNTKPIQFTTVDANTENQYAVRFAGNDLISWVFSSLYDTELIPLLPQTIFQIQNHDYGQLSTIYGLIEYDTSVSDGMFYSATCSEDWDYLTKQDITNSLKGITKQIGTVFGSDEQEEYDICQFWNVKAVPAAQKQPVVSTLPTLVLSGEYDPITPPSNGQETANHLSHSYFFTFPGQGHGQEYSSTCSNLIISTFVDDPNQTPFSSCISQMTEPDFQ